MIRRDIRTADLLAVLNPWAAALAAARDFWTEQTQPAYRAKGAALMASLAVLQNGPPGEAPVELKHVLDVLLGARDLLRVTAGVVEASEASFEQRQALEKCLTALEGLGGLIDKVQGG